MEELWNKSASELAKGIRERLFSPSEVLQAHLNRVAAVNGELNAIVRMIDEATDQARDADAAVIRGDTLGALHGVPFTVKENIDVAGYPTTDGVPAYLDAIATQDDPAVERLRNAGGIAFARTNLPDFGLRVHTRSSLYGLTRNPFDKDRTTAGSSGGEASAIASGMSPLGLGNDIGGSVRNPAYCCGIASLKPTPHRIPTASTTSVDPPSLASQLMAVTGPMARRVEDVRLAFDLLAGAHPRDPLCAPTLPVERSFPRGAVALIPGPPGGTTNPVIAESVRLAGRALTERGYTVTEIAPDSIVEARTIWSKLLLGDIVQALPSLRGIASEEAIWVLEIAAEQYEVPDLAETFKLHGERYRLQMEWSEFFQRYPVIVGPTWTEPPFLNDFDVLDQARQEWVNEQSRFVAPMNVLGLPVACVPVGMANGLPLGVQVVANRFNDGRTLAVAADLQEVFGSITPVSPWGQPVNDKN